jgi:glutathionylspermidine synthase
MFSIFKLYPWEAMVNEEFGIHAIDTYPNIRWIEPIWKMLLSNKGILPILWELYPNHDLLLPAYFEDTAPVTNKEGWQEVVTNGTGSKAATNPGAPGLDSETWVPATTSHNLTSYVRKPLLSREGANITWVHDGKTIVTTEGPYTGRAIIQALAPASAFPDNLKPNAKRFPVLGLWMVDQDCCGMGIRESGTPITDNLSSFIPHYIA